MVSTNEYKNAVIAMAVAGSEILKHIKAKAATGGDAIYNLAQIPPPATPLAVGPPGMSSDFRVTLKPNGSLELMWKCSNPSGAAGTNYQVSRKIGAEGGVADHRGERDQKIRRRDGAGGRRLRLLPHPGDPLDADRDGQRFYPELRRRLRRGGHRADDGGVRGRAMGNRQWAMAPHIVVPSQIV
jgi:hypothetical protein